MSSTPAPGTPAHEGQAAYGSAPYGAPATPGLPVPQQAFPPAAQPTAVVAMKTPGIAVLLSFLWLGAGHLYAGKTGIGLALLATNFVLLLLALIPFVGWVLAPLGWIPLFIFAAISSSGAVKEHNARFGLARY